MSVSATKPVPTNAASSGVEIDRKLQKQLMKRSDRPGIIWLTQWVALLGISGYLYYLSMDSLWMWPMMVVYGSIIALPSYALSHECAHGTAFRTRWLNEILFWISSLIYFEEPYYRRYSHARHHTYTWINQLDAQMPFKTPMTFRGWLWEISGLGYFVLIFKVVLVNALGIFSDNIREFTPASELPRLKWSARLFLTFYLLLAAAIFMGADFLLWYLVLPRIVGGPVLFLYTLLQHIDMEEDQMDIRRSTRSFETTGFSRFLYMNMNYHIEHHMYPTVPFHALPALNHAVKDQVPEPDPGFFVSNYRVLKTILARSVGRIPMVNQGKSMTMPQEQHP